MKNKKNKFSLNNLNEEDTDNFLTHKGKKLTEGNNSDDDFDQSDDEMYDKLDNYMNEIENAPDTKLSRKEIMQNIINKSKQLKIEKQNLKRKTQEKIQLLDDNFGELSELIARRPRTLGRLNDDFERMANSYTYLDKTKPTERIKSDKEIEMEKEMEIKKKLRQQIREDTDQEDNDDEKSNKSEDLEQHPDKNADEDIPNRVLTKKERIIKLMEKRLNNSTKIQKDQILLKKKTKRQSNNIEVEENEDEEEDDDDNEDNLSDLEEFDDKNKYMKKNKNNIIEEDKESFDEDDDEGEDDYEDGESNIEDDGLEEIEGGSEEYEEEK